MSKGNGSDHGEPADPSPYADPIAVEEPPAAPWYHAVDVPGHGSIDGRWDIRHCTDAYLGGFDFSGKRVLEIGPACGQQTFWMEEQGAEVVIVDLDLDRHQWDNVPGQFERRTDHAPAAQDDDQIAKQLTQLHRTRACWWWQHRVRNSKARAIYSGVYDIPASVGQFDVAVISWVLLHLKYPMDALEHVARFADTIIINERIDDRMRNLLSQASNAPLAMFVPSVRNDITGTWWQFSPPLLQQQLELLGYSRFECSDVAVTRTGFGEADREVDCFALVAQR